MLKRNFKIVILLALGLVLSNPSFGQLSRTYFLYKSEDLLSQEKYNESLPYLNTLISIDSTMSEGWFLRGVAKYNLGDIQGAANDFKKSTSVNPLLSQAYNYMAISLNRLSEHQKALDEINKALDLRPNAPEYYYTLGVTYFQMQNYQKAAEIFTKVIHLNPGNPDVWLNRGTSKLLLSDTLKAISDYNQAIRLNPFNSYSYFRRGALYADMKDYPMALSDINQSILLDSLSVDSYFVRALIYNDMNKIQDALSDLDKVLKIEPNHPLSLFNYSVLSYQTGNLETAIDKLTRLTTITPDNVLVYYYRGSIYSEKGQYKLAIKDYSSAISLFPEFANAYQNRAAAKLKTGDVKGSESDYNMAQSLQAKYKGTDIKDLENLLDSSGKFKKLISLEKDFNAATRLNLQTNRIRVTTAFLPLIKLTYAAYNIRKLDENVNCKYLDSINIQLPEKLKLALNIQKDSTKNSIPFGTIDSTIQGSYNHLLKGIVYSQNGKYANAINEFQNANKSNPENPLITISLIVEKIEMARYIEGFNQNENKINFSQVGSTSNTPNNNNVMTTYSEAIDELIKLRYSLPQNGVIAYNIGNVYILSNDFSKAIDWYTKALNENDKIPYAWYNKGLALILTSNNNEGCQDLGKAGEMGVSQAYEAIQRFCGK